jgi:hypothetical protein
VDLSKDLVSAIEEEMRAGATVDPKRVVGKWNAKVANAGVAGAHDASVPMTENAPRFSLTIVERDGTLVVDGPTPIGLKPDGGRWVGQSRDVQLELTPDGAALAGVMVRKVGESMIVIEFSAERAS